jgi:hypothetical protein
LAQLEQMHPGLKDGLLSRIAEQAEKARADLIARETLKVPAGQQHPNPVTNDERQMVAGMYERLTKFILPQLKATDVSVSAGQGGPIEIILNPQ